jgi:hypothetical protein
LVARSEQGSDGEDEEAWEDDVSNNHSGDGVNDGAEDGENAENDLAAEQFDFVNKEMRGRFCRGNCTAKPEGYSNWVQPLYRCIICLDSNWCESCYKERHESDGKWRTYYGTEYVYVKEPAEGWPGIKDGAIHIEGWNETKSDGWSKDLEEVKLSKAWEDFGVGGRSCRNSHAIISYGLTSTISLLRQITFYNLSMQRNHSVLVGRTDCQD